MKKNSFIRLVCVLLCSIFIFSLSGCEVIGSFLKDNCPHVWTDGEVIKQATCKEEGEKEVVCSLCKERKRQTISKISHEYSSEYVNDNGGHWKKCGVCNVANTKEQHEYLLVDGQEKCSVCGYVKVDAKGEISFHFMMLGNKNAGDCVYVKAGDNDILIDAGSKESSVEYIKNYLDGFVEDGKLEYVIITHAHEDHLAGFAKTNGSIFDLYECETIIDFPKTDKSETTKAGNRSLYGKYVDERTAEVALGAKRYDALECYNNQNGAQRVYDLTEDGNVKLEILYNYYYENKAKDENDYSVCVQFHHGERKFIFTGDLEADGEEYLIANNNLSQVELYKAGHHGSVSSTSKAFMSVIKPKTCVVCCCAGCDEYRAGFYNVFPSQNFINNIAPYTSQIYIPIMMDMVFVDAGNDLNDPADDNYDNTGKSVEIMNGNIVVKSDTENGVYVDCSNNQTVLKDTEWFKKYRTWPSNGVA